MAAVIAENSLGAYCSAPAAVAVLTAWSAAFFSASGGEAQANANRLTAARTGTTTRTGRACIGRAPSLGSGFRSSLSGKKHNPVSGWPSPGIDTLSHRTYYRPAFLVLL